MTVRLTNPEEDRYQRLRLIRWWDQERLQNARVLVVGAGALGNEVVKNLALLGIGHVWIVDFDRIETSNLTRSALFRAGDVGEWKSEVLAHRAREINPGCNFFPLQCDIRQEPGLHLFRRMNLIFGCLDNREARYYVNRRCYLLKKPWIDGGLDTLNGSFSLFDPPRTACYECTLTETDRKELQKRISCLKNTAPEMKAQIPTAPTIASIIGALQVQTGIRLLHKLDVPAGKRIGLYGLSDVFFEIRLEISDDCGLHTATDPLPDDIEALQASETDSLKNVLASAKIRWQADQLLWDFDRDLITSLTCTHCGKKLDFVGTGFVFQGNEICDCGGIFKPEMTAQYTGTEPWGGASYIQLGFPPDHIYCAATPGGRKYFTLQL